MAQIKYFSSNSEYHPNDWLKASTGYGGLVTKPEHLMGTKINFSQSKTLYLTLKKPLVLIAPYNWAIKCIDAHQECKSMLIV